MNVKIWQTFELTQQNHEEGRFLCDLPRSKAPTPLLTALAVLLACHFFPIAPVSPREQRTTLPFEGDFTNQGYAPFNHSAIIKEEPVKSKQ